MRRNRQDASPGIIIIGGRTHALSLARIFGGDDFDVAIVYDKSLILSEFSRYVKNFFKAPKGATSHLFGEAIESELISFLKGLLKYPDRSIALPIKEPVYPDARRDAYKRNFT